MLKYDDDYENWVSDCVESQLYKNKEEIEKRLKDIIRQDLLQPFLELLSFGYHDEQDCAYKISLLLGLDKEDFCAIDHDIEKYEEILMERRDVDMLDAQLSSYEDSICDMCECYI